MSSGKIEKIEPKTIQTVDLVRDWIENERLHGQAISTLETYRIAFERYTDWVKEQQIDQPTAADIAKFRLDLSEKYAVQTVNLTLSAVRSFYRFLVVKGMIPFSPAGDVRGMKRPKSRRHKRPALTRDEVRAVLETCEDHPIGIRDRLIIILMAYCGLRTVEVHRLNVEHLATESDRMIMKVWGKGHSEADEIAVIPKAQEPAVRAWIAERSRVADKNGPLFVSLSPRSMGGRLSKRSVRAIVKSRYRAAGVVGSDKTTHSLRHTAITQAKNGGADLMQLQTMARHMSSDTTLIYIHETNRLENPAEDLIQY